MTILTFDFYIHCFVDLCGYVDSDVGWMECDEGYAGVLLGWSCAWWMHGNQDMCFDFIRYLELCFVVNQCVI